MAFQRGDIIMVYFDLPYQETSDSHPAVIISNDDVFEEDGIYICVMMTSKKNIDKYSFEVTQDMLIDKNNKDFSQVRCHLITNVKGESIKNGRVNAMKKNSVDQLVVRISDITLSS